MVDKHHHPLQPCSPARARTLLAKGRAVVHRRTPFVIRLKDRAVAESEVDGVEIGVDPGSKHTGIAVFTHQAGQSTRWALWRALDVRMLTRTASGGRTKWNRQRCGLGKSHTLDALCVGTLDTVTETVTRVLVAGCTGRGTHARTRPDKHGFPRLRLPRRKRFFAFATGDLVRAVVPTGTKAGTHTGRVAVRATGKFNITTTHGTVQGVHYRHVRLLQRADGYAYTMRKEERGFPSRLKTEVSAPNTR